MFWADYTLDPNWFEPVDGSGPYAVPLTTGACQAFRRHNFLAVGRYESASPAGGSRTRRCAFEPGCWGTAWW